MGPGSGAGQQASGRRSKSYIHYGIKIERPPRNIDQNPVSNTTEATSCTAKYSECTAKYSESDLNCAFGGGLIDGKAAESFCTVQQAFFGC